MRTGIGLCLGFGLVALLGCGGPAQPYGGTIHGVVSFDGKPIHGGQIAFIPRDGKTYAAEIQANGEYTISGLPLGEAIILVHPAVHDDETRLKRIKELKGAMPPAPPRPFPARYSNPEQSELRCTVTAGNQEHQVEMHK